MSQPGTKPFDVQHNPAESRFELVVDGHLAMAEYRREGGQVVFTHTFVPPELRGRGLAEKLVRAALAWARAERLQIRPACSYVAAFIERHPEYRTLLGD